MLQPMAHNKSDEHVVLKNPSSGIDREIPALNRENFPGSPCFDQTLPIGRMGES